jgi:hypothetical protein
MDGRPTINLQRHASAFKHYKRRQGAGQSRERQKEYGENAAYKLGLATHAARSLQGSPRRRLPHLSRFSTGGCHGRWYLGVA